MSKVLNLRLSVFEPLPVRLRHRHRFAHLANILIRPAECLCDEQRLHVLLGCALCEQLRGCTSCSAGDQPHALPLWLSLRGPFLNCPLLRTLLALVLRHLLIKRRFPAVTILGELGVGPGA